MQGGFFAGKGATVCELAKTGIKHAKDRIGIKAVLLKCVRIFLHIYVCKCRGIFQEQANGINMEGINGAAP